MAFSLVLVKRCLLLCLLFLSFPNAQAEWRTEQSLRTEQKVKKAKPQVQKGPKGLRNIGEDFAVFCLILAFFVLIAGTVTAIGFIFNGLAGWGIATLICGSYVGFASGVLLISVMGSFGMGSVIGAYMGVATAILAGLLNALPLLLAALAKNMAGLALGGGILLAALALIVALAYAFV